MAVRAFDSGSTSAAGDHGDADKTQGELVDSTTQEKQQSDQRGLVSWIRTNISTPLGFHKIYNLPLFIIFACALFGFSLARLSYLNISGGSQNLSSFLAGAPSYSAGAGPGEWFHMHAGRYRVGITIHLAACLPMGVLCVWQFLPVIRHKFLILHRINGYVVILLGLTSNAGALIIANKAFGGSIEAQTCTGMLSILTTVSMGLAYYNIKRLQIDQHRNWMLRAFFYYGTIISIRIIQAITAQIITIMHSFYQIQSCDQVRFMYGGSLEKAAALYAVCADGKDHPIVVVADFFATARPEQIAAAYGVPFGVGMWLALCIHFVGVEIYLNLTPRETERLRLVSYEKQLEAGMKNPGSAGLVRERWGDADEWIPTR